MSLPVIIPPLMPEEFIKGWRGRVAMVNMKNSLKAAQDLICLTAHSRRKEFSKSTKHLQYLAIALEISPEQLLRGHTLLPYFGATHSFSFRSYTELVTNFWHPFGCRSAVYLATTAFPIFCPACTREDLGYWGFSYWRRSHQLPGMLKCSKHGITLKSARTRNAFLLPPDLALNDCMALPIDVDACLRNVYVLRAMSFAETILLEARYVPPMDLRSVSKLLVGRSSVDCRDYRKPVRDAFETRFPADWLELVHQPYNWTWDSDLKCLNRVLCRGDIYQGTARDERRDLPDSLTTTVFCMIMALIGGDLNHSLDDISSPTNPAAALANTPTFEGDPYLFHAT